jgi:hypothetical protein
MLMDLSRYERSKFHTIFFYFVKKIKYNIELTTECRFATVDREQIRTAAIDCYSGSRTIVDNFEVMC